jgi:hypothetical protein
VTGLQQAGTAISVIVAVMVRSVAAVASLFVAEAFVSAVVAANDAHNIP